VVLIVLVALIVLEVLMHGSIVVLIVLGSSGSNCSRGFDAWFYSDQVVLFSWNTGGIDIL